MGQKSGYTSTGKTAMDKANRFLEHIRPFDWDGKVTQHEDGVTHCFASRGERETIDIWWAPPKGSIITAPLYKLAGETIKLNNVSACVAIAIKPADMSRLTKAIKRGGKKRVGIALDSSLTGDDGAAGTTTLGEAISAARSEIRGSLDGSDADVRRALLGNRIQWINSKSGLTETAVVSKINKIVRNGKDYVDFVDAWKKSENNGFHAVYLQNIVSIA